MVPEVVVYVIPDKKKRGMMGGKPAGGGGGREEVGRTERRKCLQEWQRKGKEFEGEVSGWRRNGREEEELGGGGRRGNNTTHPTYQNTPPPHRKHCARRTSLRHDDVRFGNEINLGQARQGARCGVMGCGAALRLGTQHEASQQNGKGEHRRSFFNFQFPGFLPIPY